MNGYINGRQGRKTHRHSVQVANRTLIKNELLGLDNEANCRHVNTKVHVKRIKTRATFKISDPTFHYRRDMPIGRTTAP